MLQTDPSCSGVSGFLSVLDGMGVAGRVLFQTIKGQRIMIFSIGVKMSGCRGFCKTFDVSLHRRTFKVETDNKALETLLPSRVLNSKLMRWALYLQEFSMSITYIPGKYNQNADGLSCQGWDGVLETDMMNSTSKNVDENVHLFKRGEMSGNSPTLNSDSACV